MAKKVETSTSKPSKKGLYLLKEQNCDLLSQECRKIYEQIKASLDLEDNKWKEWQQDHKKRWKTAMEAAREQDQVKRSQDLNAPRELERERQRIDDVEKLRDWDKTTSLVLARLGGCDGYYKHLRLRLGLLYLIVYIVLVEPYSIARQPREQYTEHTTEPNEHRQDNEQNRSKDMDVEELKRKRVGSLIEEEENERKSLCVYENWLPSLAPRGSASGPSATILSSPKFLPPRFLRVEKMKDSSDKIIVYECSTLEAMEWVNYHKDECVGKASGDHYALECIPRVMISKLGNSRLIYSVLSSDCWTKERMSRQKLTRCVQLILRRPVETVCDLRLVVSAEALSELEKQ